MLISSVWRGNSRWWFAAGMMLGGLVSAVVAVAAGMLLIRPLLPGPAEAGLVAAAFAMFALHEFGVVRLRLPQYARQVPEAISDDGAGLGALQFGFEMGTGARTHMTSALPHALVVGVLLIAGWRHAVIAGLLFGAGRALMTLSRVASPDEERWDGSLARHERRIRAILTLTAAGALAVVAPHTF